MEELAQTAATALQEVIAGLTASATSSLISRKTWMGLMSITRSARQDSGMMLTAAWMSFPCIAFGPATPIILVGEQQKP
ncbi:MAG: hypothetical protein D6797_03960 [Bdellovibrio sp.]|nr:MAG: hypothetical protein D6797_03960 [Bdellovibrio sp.]